VDLEFPLPLTPKVTPTEVLQILAEGDSGFIAKKRLAQSASLVVLSDYTEIRPLLQIICTCRFLLQMVNGIKRR
jgi:hypothetical protein